MTSAPPTVPTRRDVEFWLVSTTLVALLVATAALAAWPIYEAASFVVLVIVASVVGAMIALLSTLRRWGALTVASVCLLAYLVLSLPLGIPGAFSSLENLPGGLWSAVTAPVTAWKELVTIQIPVGSYLATSIPALIVFLLGTTLALLAAWRLDRRSFLAVPVLLAMQLFGLAFGASAVSAPLVVGGFSLPAPRETALSLTAFAILILLLVWRMTWARRQALYRARSASGVRNTASHRPAALRRSLVAAGMLATAIVVSGVALAPVAAPGGREVLRTAIEPELRVRDAVSPLSTYRLGFGDELYDTELFSVELSDGAVDRLRLAALTYYDGAVFRVAEPDPGSGADTDFRRVPTVLPGAGPGESSTLSIEIAALDGVWIPLPAQPTRIEFGGPRRAALVDSFYYSASLGTGIGLMDDGLEPGDRWQIEAVETQAPELASLPPVAPEQRVADEAVPEELVEWVQEQELGLDGASLQELVDRLLSRGYLSHSLTIPTGQSPWTEALAGYTFAPSRSGHDSDRIATIFATLLEREREVGDEALLDDALLVSAVGDDEQFATAVALLARHFGYESRVALGFRISAPSSVSAPAPCLDGVCRGGNLTAWAEVRPAGGEWISVDASPQFSDPLTPAISTVRDPELPTDVPSQVAESRLSPEAAPADGEGTDETEAEDGVDLEWLWSALRALGLTVLVIALVLAPFLTIIGAKALRRSARRKAPGAESRITGGWLEWIDSALDHGAKVPSNVTRTESASSLVALRAPVAAEYGDGAPQYPLVLAEWADRAVFAAHPPTLEDSDAFWAIVDDERRRWRSELSFWQRIRSALSLASFTRAIDARMLMPPQARSAFTQRRQNSGTTPLRSRKGVTRTRRTGRSPQS